MFCREYKDAAHTLMEKTKATISGLDLGSFFWRK
jgi:hypothetical protein